MLSMVLTITSLISLSYHLSIQSDAPEPGGSACHSSVAAHNRYEDLNDSSLCKGWPVNLNAPGAGFPYTPTLFDINGDGACEIFLTGGETFGLSGDGSFLPGWPTADMAYMGYATNAQMAGPSCADIDNNGLTEIMWTLRDWYAGSSHLWTFNGKLDSGADLSGFPITAPDQSSNALNSPFVLGDADGDGTLEAVTAHTLGNNFEYYRISSVDHNGNIVYTTDLDPGENILNVYFGDADGNGFEEFFFVSIQSGSYSLHLLDASGNHQTGYPVILYSPGGTQMFGPPVPADLDGDGDIEIITGYAVASTAYAIAAHHDGTAVANFPITVGTGSQLFYLGLGDITADGYPELLAFDNELASDYRVWAIDIPSGNPLPGWPVELPNWPKGFPTVVDVDNNGFQDVCCVTDGGLMYALSAQGSILSGFPKTMSNASVSGVAAGDIDGDGLYELIAATWDGWVYAWETTGVVTASSADWPMRGIDSRNTGIYRGAGQSGIHTPEQPDESCITIGSNPATDSALFTVSGAASVTVGIYDITGKKLCDAVDTGSNQHVWFPGDDAAPGLYFAVIQGAATSPVRFTLIL